MHRFWKGASILSKADPSLAIQVTPNFAEVKSAAYNDSAYRPEQKIRFRNGQLVVDGLGKVLGVNDGKVYADPADVEDGSQAHMWDLSKRGGNNDWHAQGLLS